MNTTTQKKYDLSNLFVFSDYEGDVQKTFLEEVGTLVFQSALMRYLAEHTYNEAETFENFIQSHVASETFVEELCSDYPDFEELLNAEMRSFCREVKN